jgi:transcriptional regulator with XRE-family HTH domain
MAAWNRAFHGQVAMAIVDARHGRFTANQLADETDVLGYPISRSQIKNYESGRRQSLEILELLVISQALGVPALSLLFPGDTAEILPGHRVPTVAAKQKFVGDGLLREITDLMTALSRIDAAMGGGTAGMGALTASTFAATTTINATTPEIGHLQLRAQDQAPTKPPPARTMSELEVKRQHRREEQELNQPLQRR